MAYFSVLLPFSLNLGKFAAILAPSPPTPGFWQIAPPLVPGQPFRTIIFTLYCTLKKIILQFLKLSKLYWLAQLLQVNYIWQEKDILKLKIFHMQTPGPQLNSKNLKQIFEFFWSSVHFMIRNIPQSNYFCEKNIYSIWKSYRHKHLVLNYIQNMMHLFWLFSSPVQFV